MLSQLSDSSHNLTRTVTEYGTSYELSVPDDIFDVSTFMGHVEYTLDATDAGPRLSAQTCPDTPEYAPNTLFVLNRERLPLPRGLVELVVPSEISQFTEQDGTLSSSISMTQYEAAAGEVLALTTTQLVQQSDSTTLTLPSHEKLQQTPYVSPRLVWDANDLCFVLVATISEPMSGAYSVQNVTSCPTISLPASVASTLPAESLRVELRDGGALSTRSVLAETYSNSLGTTVEPATATSIPVPEDARSVLNTPHANSGYIQVEVEDDTPLVLFNPHATDGLAEFTYDDSKGVLTAPAEIVDLLFRDGQSINWYAYDGLLVVERLGACDRCPEFDGPSLAQGTLSDSEIHVPATVCNEANVGQQHLETALCASDGHLCVTFEPDSPNEDGGSSSETEQSYSLSEVMQTVLSPGRATGVLACIASADQMIACTSLSETEFKRRSLSATVDDLATTNLELPVDGRNAVVRLTQDDSAAVGLPKTVRNEFASGPAQLTLGTASGFLALEATPVQNTSNALGYIRDGELELPVELASALSLLDAESSWGQTRVGADHSVIGLIDGPSVQDADLHPRGSGLVMHTGTTMYDQAIITIPESVFAAFDERPPGVFVSCELVNGSPRLVLIPIGESDLMIPGASKLVSSSETEATLEFQVSGALASVMQFTENLEIKWAETDYGIIGTPQTVFQEI